MNTIGIGTMFLSTGNAFTFGGLSATLPSEERFAKFRARFGVDASPQASWANTPL